MKHRVQILYFIYLLGIVAIILRLSYWQLVKGAELSVQARDQYESKSIISPKRGDIVSADGHPLVINEPRFTLGAYTPHLDVSRNELIDKIMPLLTFEIDDPEIATDSAKLRAKQEELRSSHLALISERLASRSYAVLANNLTSAEKSRAEELKLGGLTFEESYIRGYPEASLSAHVAGFVGRNDVGEATGYFGLEGYYNRELTGRVGYQKQEKDAIGNPLLVGNFRELEEQNGRQLQLHIARNVQYLVESELKKGLERYGAVSGEVIVMDPASGAILAMVSLPTYDPAKFYKFDPSLYKNPAIANAFEPGSTFKVLVMAAAINEGAISLDEKCDICDGPLPIDKFTIKTWNGEYHRDSTPAEILANSDNIGMVWVQRKLGGDKFLQYLKDFGFGEKTGIDLQEEITPDLRKKWGEIDYATASFGQGIAVTSIQMLRAVAALGNGGMLMQPQVVHKISGSSELLISPKEVRRVISEESAAKITNLMVASADHGDAKWARLPNYRVAGKTGTAQIPVAGHYDAEKTIASFVGFAPADKPKFAMLVKLREPTSSPWGSETAAPLWFTIAGKLLLHYNIPPDSP